MKNKFWHLYYGGTDCVDLNDNWRKNHLEKDICPICGNYIFNENKCIDLVVDQKIPKKSDMFSTGYLLPAIISENLILKFGGKIENFLNFGKIYISGSKEALDTHYAFSGKRPWITLYGNDPSIMDGKVVKGPKNRHCQGCGISFGSGRGKRYINNNEVPIMDISVTDFGGLLVTEEIRESLINVKLKDVRLEEILVR